MAPPKPPATPASERKPVDWLALKPHYEAGIIPLRKLGVQFGCSDAAIIQHAARQTPPWQRNMKGRIQAAADDKVRQAALSNSVSAKRKEKAAEAEVIEVNASLQATIRLEHRSHVRRARALALELQDELEELTSKARTAKGKNGTAAAKLDSLDTRSKISKNLGETLQKLLSMERQAYGIEGGGDAGDGEDGDFVKRMLNARSRATRQ